MTRLVTSKFWLQGDVHEQLKIDGDTYFTEALIQNASENENLTITRDEITILSIGLYALQQLNYRVWLYSKDDFAADSLIGYVDFNLPAVGATKNIGGTTYYYYNISDVGLAYEDEDSTKELHIQLENKSATAKIAAAGGKVQMMLFYGVNS